VADADRLLHPSRGVDRIIYRAELDRLAAQTAQFTLTHTLTHQESQLVAPPRERCGGSLIF
jgi:ferredoxin-NADP reductase